MKTQKPPKYEVRLNILNEAPHTCPVCMGKGIVPNGFYLSAHPYITTSTNTPEKCKSCNGTGIVWH